MSQDRLVLIGVFCVVAPMLASANDVPAAPPKTASPHAVKTKTIKPPATQGQTLGDIPFSNPYAPPVGAGKGAAGDFAPAHAAAPVEPKGGLALTYKWHASSEPTDPFWNIRNDEYGPDGPGSKFLGGLKLGF
jgi:hypothetical protein